MNEATYLEYVTPGDLVRLEQFAEVVEAVFDRPSSFDAPPPPDAVDDERFAGFASRLSGLIVCHGAPVLSEAVLERATFLGIVGDLEGDRFARRVDIGAAARRGVRVVDSTHASASPVAEWALALALIGLRGAGGHFRRLAAGEMVGSLGDSPSGVAYGRELSGARVGLIGIGFIGRRLVEILRPFRVQALVHDPFAPRELADALDVTFTSLDRVMSTCDVVFCLVPNTPRTYRMIGERELNLLRGGSVFVNVSRGSVVDTDALTVRLRRGDVTACLDVYDPEPIPVDAELRTMPNVFLSPHIAGVTQETGPRFFTTMVDAFARHFAGDEPVGLLEQAVVQARTSSGAGSEPPEHDLRR
jgi:phosphoglycerate dehydrogenase-like enzyme